MSLLIFALLALIVGGIAIAIIRRVVPEYGDIASLVVLLVIVLVVAQRAGLF